MVLPHYFYCGNTALFLLLLRGYRKFFTIPTVLPWNFPHLLRYYRGYRGITAFPITVSSLFYNYYKSENADDILAMSSRSAASNITASSCSVGTRRKVLPGDSSLPSRRRCWGSSCVLVELRRVLPAVLVLQRRTHIISKFQMAQEITNFMKKFYTLWNST